jgi:guanylate kinase
VSHTTRAPRPGEENGVHYNFVEKVAMEDDISKGLFIEYAHVHTNIYGTSIAAVDRVKSEGKICILDIDIQGVQSVKKSSLEAKYLFINPPSVEDLEARLRGRGTETEEKIQVRLKNAIGELEFGKVEGNFDASVTNDNLDRCFDEICTIISGWYPSVDLTALSE